MNLETKLTRREFLATSGSLLILPELVLPQVKSVRITFEEAKQNLSLRQKYIDQLVGDLFGSGADKYVSKFIYDHEGEETRRAEFALFEQVENNPKYHSFLRRQLNVNKELLKSALDRYSEDEKFKKMNEMDKVVKIIEFLNTEEGIKDYANFIKYKIGEYFIDDSYGTTIPDHFEFGAGKKSKVFIYDKIFGNIDLEILQPRWITRTSSEDFIKSILQHEYRHAKDIFEGIEVGNGLHLNNNNFLADQDATDFIQETSAYQHQIEEARKLNKASDNAEEKYHTAYLYAISHFNSIFNKSVKKILEKELSPNVNALFEASMRKMRPILEEANKVLVDVFYDSLK